MNNTNPFDNVDDDRVPLRTVALELIATFLACDPAKLATALRRLSTVPSAIRYHEDQYACICSAYSDRDLDASAAQAQAGRHSHVAAVNAEFYETAPEKAKRKEWLN